MKGRKVKKGECINADLALMGCHLMQKGICGEEKEKIKNELYKIIVAYRKNAIKTKKLYV